MYYLYFDAESGNIIKCTNELSPEDSNEYIEIDEETYINFVSGAINILSYYVLPGKTKGTFDLTETTDKLDFDIARSIHEFPKTKSKLVKENVFYIIQNLKKKEWQARAKLTDQYIKFLNHYIKINKTQKIYVTEENNPNVLLDILEIPMENFLKSKTFVIKKEDTNIIDRNDISLYCYVKHEDYYHRIIGQ